ncbi:hypothetical protein O4H49_03015 [Kiloniella laminariae]|uniref:Uncharacterized protein n=1 Tax=Kiloniella laminariae TaxID=454162 RepID=A0ABT4LF56_9PROT|nr:hypothetical protein [Kiloniella laminariae]MCZ4279734.1 hypothetical protein [Kiloniella laminariae]
MEMLKSIWTAMITRDVANSATDSPIVLIVNDYSYDLVFHTFKDTAQKDQSAGQANLYKLDVAGGIYPDSLTDSSIRIAIRGDDLWRPESFFLWGETTSGAVEPLAYNKQIKFTLSTDPNEGNFSAALPRAYGPNSPAVRAKQPTPLLFSNLLVLMTTASAHDSGTNNKLSLEVVGKNGTLYLDSVLKAKGQSNHGTAQANFYEVQETNRFFKHEIESMTLSISGSDAWKPDNFFVFGYDDLDGVQVFTPLVNIPKWTFGSLSTDKSEGKTSLSLPLF